MTTDHRPTLKELWDQLPAGSPPVEELVRNGRRRVRRARLLTGACAVVILALGIGTAATLAGRPDSDAGGPSTATPSALEVATIMTGERSSVCRNCRRDGRPK